MRTVYISDLDGTLLGRDARLSDFSRRTLQELLREGLLFTAASARGVVSIRTMLEGLTLPLPVIEFNGAFLSDLASGRHHLIHSIAPTVVEGVHLLIRRFRCIPLVSSFNGSEDCAYYSEVLNNDIKMFQMADRGIAVANATEALKRHATRVIGPNDEDSVVQFIREDWVRDG